MVLVLKPAAAQARVPARFLAEGRRRVVLVGIGGPSGGGKSTMARELVNRLGAPLGSICADQFYDHTSASMQKTGVSGEVRNLENPDCIDTKLLLSELYRIGKLLADATCAPRKVVLETPLNSCVNLTKKGCVDPGTPLGDDTVVLVVEGFLLFHNAEVAAACTHRLWIDLDREVAMQRRYNRDGDKKFKIDQKFIDWYCSVVWANYEKYRPEQLDNADRLEPDVFHIDGDQSNDRVLDEAVQHLTAHLKCGGLRKQRNEVSLKPSNEASLKPRTNVGGYGREMGADRSPRIKEKHDGYSRERCAHEGERTKDKHGGCDDRKQRNHASGRRTDDAEQDGRRSDRRPREHARESSHDVHERNQRRRYSR